MLRRAHAASQTFVTIDKDFGELAVVRGAPHFGIVRLVDIPARAHGRFAAAAIARYADELRRGRSSPSKSRERGSDFLKPDDRCRGDALLVSADTLLPEQRRGATADEPARAKMYDLRA